MLASVIVVIESMRFKNQVCAIDAGTEDVTCGRNTYGLATGEYSIVLLSGYMCCWEPLYSLTFYSNSIHTIQVSLD